MATESAVPPLTARLNAVSPLSDSIVTSASYLQYKLKFN